jgi:hypothetical protein
VSRGIAWLLGAFVTVSLGVLGMVFLKAGGFIMGGIGASLLMNALGAGGCTTRILAGLPDLWLTEPEAHILRCLENLPDDPERRRALMPLVRAALLGET